MVAKKKTTKIKTVVKTTATQKSTRTRQSFFVKEWQKHHTIGLIVAILLGITAILLFITYFSNNA